jgi:hypothetical protein
VQGHARPRTHIGGTDCQQALLPNKLHAAPPSMLFPDPLMGILSHPAPDGQQQDAFLFGPAHDPMLLELAPHDEGCGDGAGRATTLAALPDHVPVSKEWTMRRIAAQGARR